MTRHSLLAASIIVCVFGCSDDSAPRDASTDTPLDAALDATDLPDASRDVGEDVGSDATTDVGSDADLDTTSAVTHFGVVAVGDGDSGGFVGRIRGAFVRAGEVDLITEQRTPIDGAPSCFELLPPPPVVPDYVPAGTLAFSGLVLAAHTLDPTDLDDYSFDYANLLETPDDPITLTVPGAGEVDPAEATVATPQRVTGGAWLLGSTGISVTWDAGNGDFVLLYFGVSEGQRVCEVADSGSFLIPAAAYEPDAMPAGGMIRTRRIIESTTRSGSGTHQLRFRAFAETNVGSE